MQMPVQESWPRDNTAPRQRDHPAWGKLHFICAFRNYGADFVLNSAFAY